MEMVKKNKMKAQEKKQTQALAAAKAKIEERMQQLERNAKKTQKSELKKAKKHRQKMEREEKRIEKKTQKMEEERLDMQSKVEEIKATEKEARNQLKTSYYKTTNDECNHDNDNGNELALLQARKNALMLSSEPMKLGELASLDNNLTLDLEIDGRLMDLEDLEGANQRGREIEAALVEAEKAHATKKCRDIVEADSFALAHDHAVAAASLQNEDQDEMKMKKKKKKKKDGGSSSSKEKRTKGKKKKSSKKEEQ